MTTDQRSKRIEELVDRIVQARDQAQANQRESSGVVGPLADSIELRKCESRQQPDDDLTIMSSISVNPPHRGGSAAQGSIRVRESHSDRGFILTNMGNMLSAAHSCVYASNGRASSLVSVLRIWRAHKMWY